MIIGLNDRAEPLVEALKHQAGPLRLGISTGARGETLLDAGLAATGSLAAGVAVAEIAMAGLGQIALVASPAGSDEPPSVAVRSSQPVLACLGSQLAGWHVHDDASGFRALGSGPARALAAREGVFGDMGWRDASSSAVLLLECDRVPPPVIADEVAEACGLHPSRLTLILVPAECLAGSVQIAARLLEAAIGKARRAGFPLDDIVDGLARSPLAPPNPDPAESVGRSNDAMIYGGSVHLYVTGPASAARDLARRLPSDVSSQHGRPFASILAEAGGDFYAVDPLLFGPATVRVTALASGETFVAGTPRPDLVRRALGEAEPASA